jgi:hypothetical protein
MVPWYVTQVPAIERALIGVALRSVDDVGCRGVR